jgi:LPXTG-motif cell wall-anchored protein
VGPAATVGGAEVVSGQLPLTGASSMRLAALGVLLIAGGLAMALRRRRFAR